METLVAAGTKLPSKHIKEGPATRQRARSVEKEVMKRLIVVSAMMPTTRAKATPRVQVQLLPTME
jgi:hypothetical protein